MGGWTKVFYVPRARSARRAGGRIFKRVPDYVPIITGSRRKQGRFTKGSLNLSEEHM